MYVILNLFTNEVKYKSGNEEYRTIYRIAEANNSKMKVVSIKDANAIDNKANCELADTNQGVKDNNKMGRMVMKICHEHGDITVENLIVQCDLNGAASCNGLFYGQDIVINTGNGNMNLDFEVGSASTCVGAMEMGACYNASVDIYKVTGGYFDKKGRGVSLSTGVGLGAGGALYTDSAGITTVEFNAFGTGITLKFDISSSGGSALGGPSGIPYCGPNVFDAKCFSLGI